MQASNETYVAPDIKRQERSVTKLKRHFVPDKAYVVPDRRMGTVTLPKHDMEEDDDMQYQDYEDDAQYSPAPFLPSFWRKFYHPMADDDKVPIYT